MAANEDDSAGKGHPGAQADSGSGDTNVASAVDALIAVHQLSDKTHHHPPGGFAAPPPNARFATPQQDYKAPDAADLDKPLLALASSDMRRSTKVEALAKLARQGYPGRQEHDGAYAKLAASIAPDVHPDQLLKDFRSLADSADAFRRTETGQQLEFHEYAFAVGDCVCTALPVTVDGKDAAWIYSEFDTDASFERCIDWMQPTNWPVDSSLLFQAMLTSAGQDATPADVVRPPTTSGPGDAWYAQYLEVVQLLRQVQTQLRFDYEERDKYAALSYVLDSAIDPNRGDGQINVDRGFLSVNDLGPIRHVKALKIVGFSDGTFTEQALTVCPIWSDFVKGAVEGATIAYCAQDLDDSCDDLTAFATDTFAENVEVGTAWARAAVQKDYCVEDAVNDSAAVWLKLANDWTEAWTHGYALAESLAARSDLFTGELKAPPPGLRPPPPRRATSITGSIRPGGRDHIETISIPIQGLVAGATGQISDLVLANGASTPTVIPAAAISAKVVNVRPRGGTVRAELGLRIDTLHRPPGLYGGTYTFTVDGASRSVPVHFYISRALRRS